MHVLSLVLVALLLSISAALSAVVADDKKVEAFQARDDYTKELSDLGRSSDARETRSVGEHALAEYIVRRLAETEHAIDVFAARQKTLLRQDIAEFALSFAGPSDGTSETRAMRMSEPKKQAASRVGVQGVVDERAQAPAQHMDLQSDYTNTNAGNDAGAYNQGEHATAFGFSAGSNNQGEFATAVGWYAGYESQGYAATAVGWNAGYGYQGEHAVAVGMNAGFSNQGENAIAFGHEAGSNNQGNSSVAIGVFAGNDNQHANTIIISASGTALNSEQTDSFYVKPIRGVDQASVPSSARELRYDPDSGEIFYILTAPTALPTNSTTNTTRHSAVPSSRPVAIPKSPTKRPSRRPTKRPSKKTRSVRV